ncbi:MAG TPA: hypothetical protein VGE91_06680 [Solirubrobacterales bacterium]
MRRTVFAGAGTVAVALALLASAAQPAAAASCPTTVGNRAFASAAQLHATMKKIVGFGQLRNAGSRSLNQEQRWLESRLKRIRGMRVRSDPYYVRSWQPTTKVKKGPGRDLARAGELRLPGPNGSTRVPVAGAVPYSRPTNNRGSGGPLVYLPPDVPITAENSAGRVVIRDFPQSSIPAAGIQFLSLYITPDLASQTADYARPYLAPLNQEMFAAGTAGAAGLIFTFDVPRKQVRGYWDPHDGTHYKLPGLFVGVDQGAQLKALATSGRSARVIVHAQSKRAKTRNLIATLRGQSPQRIVLSTHTDGVTWVQENGTAGVLAMARYLAGLPKACRPRTFQFAFGSGHLGFARDGTELYARKLDPQYDEGSIAFAFALEHMGTREILPVPDADGFGQHLVFTGQGESYLFGAGDSDALQKAAVDATIARHLDHTAVLKGLGVPVGGQAPPICSMGGIGTAFQTHLIPTLAMISGPWSLWAPSFGAKAVDFSRMRGELLAAGDAVLALQGLPNEQIAGDYPHYRAERAAGTPTCSTALPTQ